MAIEYGALVFSLPIEAKKMAIVNDGHGKCSPSAVSTLRIGVLLAVNGHLRRQKSSTYFSRPPVSSLHLPIECGASTLNLKIDKALGFFWVFLLNNHLVYLRRTLKDPLRHGFFEKN